MTSRVARQHYPRSDRYGITAGMPGPAWLFISPVETKAADPAFWSKR